MSERGDSRAVWPIESIAGPLGTERTVGFTVRWRTGTRVQPESDAPPTGATVVDLRERIELSARHRLRWEREPASDVLDRIVFRLVGDRHTTRSIVDRVVGAAAAVDPRRVVTEALSQVLEHEGPLGEIRILRIDGVAFGDHRRRLCRELLRWPTPERVGLALRHLGELPVEEIAAIMDTSVEELRAVSSTWWPDDDNPRGVDVATRRPLRHLDPMTSAVRG